MELKKIKLEIPHGCNIILGHSHFIKTVEDIYEIMMNSISGAKFGLAFSEASEKRLVRKDGTEKELIDAAVRNILALSAGHSFIIILRDAFPINVLNSLKQCFEVVNIFCATANPVEVILAETKQGCGILGVVDGYSPLGVESENDENQRKKFLQQIGYKR